MMTISLIILSMFVMSSHVPVHTAITLSANKFVFGTNEVQLCGYTVSSKGYTVDPAEVFAISEFPMPVNLSRVLLWFN